jgi:DEAD/DEAH box helicase domain-containing protein
MPDDFEPMLFLYDNLPGGVGFSEGLYTAHEELLERTLSLISGCPCANGCPSCVGPINYIGRESKKIARALLELIRCGS